MLQNVLLIRITGAVEVKNDLLGATDNVLGIASAVDTEASIANVNIT